MSIQFTFRRRERGLRLTDLILTSGGLWGKRIVYNGSSLRFRAVASPLVVREKLPPDFFQERVRRLTPAESRRLSKELARLDFSGWQSDDHFSFPAAGPLPTQFWCRFSDGWEFRYETEGEAPEGFHRLVKRLWDYSDDKVLTPQKDLKTGGMGRPCKDCHTLIPLHADYCPCCGRPQERPEQSELRELDCDPDLTVGSCPRCEGWLPVDYLYCPYCGLDLVKSRRRG